MTSSLVSLHVAANAECFAAPRLRALVRLLASVTVAVDAQAAWARECLVAGRANVPVLRLWKCRLARRAHVVVVLPWIRTVARRCGHRDRHWHRLRLEVGRQWPLSIHTEAAVGLLLGRVERGGRSSTWGRSVRRLRSVHCVRVGRRRMSRPGVSLHWGHRRSRLALGVRLHVVQ